MKNKTKILIGSCGIFVWLILYVLNTVNQNEKLQLFYWVFLGLVWLIFYIGTLIKQAKRSEWVWFVFTLLLNPTLLIYWIYRAIKVWA